MPRAVRVVCERDLDWREVLLDDAEQRVHVARLRLEPRTNATRSLVRFPPGWSRPRRGSYDAAEEVLFLEGGFQMSEVWYGPDHYAWFPPAYLRMASSSTQGALALAWFSGTPRWRRSQRAPTPIRGRLWRTLPVRQSPFGMARLLHTDGKDSTWVAEESVETAGPSMSDVEVFSLSDRCYALVPAGRAVPMLRPPLFFRIRETDDAGIRLMGSGIRTRDSAADTVRIRPDGF